MKILQKQATSCSAVHVEAALNWAFSFLMFLTFKCLIVHVSASLPMGI